MNIEDLKARVYFLAGQLEEAKKMFNDALREIEANVKEKQTDNKSETISSSNGSKVSVGESA